MGNHPAYRLTLLLQRRAALFLALWFLVTAAALFATSRLRMTANLSELLPKNLQSVLDLDELNHRVGGAGNFIVAIENEDLPAAQRYADALVEKIQKEISPEFIRYVEYRNNDQRDFFEKNKYLYAEVEDLEQIHDRLKRKIEFEITCKNALFFDLTGQCKKDPGFDMSDIQKKYHREEGRYDQFHDGYFTSADGKLLAIVVKPTGDPSAIVHVRDFLKTIRPVIASLDPASFHPSLKIHFTGSYAQADEEYSAMVRDAAFTGMLALVLILAILFFYYRSVRMIAFVGLALFCSLAWTYGLAYVLIGVLTSQTAFMGSIVLGNSANNVIVFLARYLEERKRDFSSQEALARAAAATIGASFASAFTAAAAFGVLAIADMRAYRQFAVIGAIGMVLSWVATHFFLPCLLAAGERIKPLSPSAISERGAKNLTGWVVHLVTKHPKRLALLGAFLTASGIVGSLVFWSDPYEHDYSNIRTARSLRSGSGFWNRKLMDEVFDLSLTPNVILAENREEANQIREVLLARRDADPTSVIDTVRTLDSFIPERQGEKLEWMGKIRKLLEGQAVKFLSKDQRAEIDRIKGGFDLKPIQEEDIPQSVRRHFVELDGSVGKIVYVFPNNEKFLWIVENGLKFADEVQHVPLQNGKIVTGSGEGVVFADIVRLVHRAGPTILVAAFVCVYFFLLLEFRNPLRGLVVFLPMIVAFSWLGLLMLVTGVRLTFLNFLVLPMAVGISIDYSIHIFHRYSLEKDKNVGHVLRTTGAAVILCSLTVTTGYAVLLLAQSRAIVNFGKLGLLAEICALSTAILFTPTVLSLRGSKGEKREA
ncbi:MAG: MMPL family transporter [Bdellovibrionota bacterium]